MALTIISTTGVYTVVLAWMFSTALLILTLLIWVFLRCFHSFSCNCPQAPPPRPRRGRGWPGFFSRSGLSVRGWRRQALARLRSRRRWLAGWRGAGGGLDK